MRPDVYMHLCFTHSFPFMEGGGVTKYREVYQYLCKFLFQDIRDTEVFYSLNFSVCTHMYTQCMHTHIPPLPPHATQVTQKFPPSPFTLHLTHKVRRSLSSAQTGRLLSLVPPSQSLHPHPHPPLVPPSLPH